MVRGASALFGVRMPFFLLWGTPYTFRVSGTSKQADGLDKVFDIFLSNRITDGESMGDFVFLC